MLFNVIFTLQQYVGPLRKFYDISSKMTLKASYVYHQVSLSVKVFTWCV